MDKIYLGKIGESYSQKYLIQNNYVVMSKNYYTRYGEIDIIAIDLQSKQLVFVEVKTRRSYSFGRLEELLSKDKLRKLFTAINIFLMNNKISGDISWRIDLIALKLSANNKVEKIKHIKNIKNG